MPPFEIQRIDHVVFRVQDLNNSVDFYRKVLGCEVVRSRQDLDLVHLRAGASMIDLLSTEGPLGRLGGTAPEAGGRNVDHLCLRIEPFNEAELIDHLNNFNAPVRGEAAENFGAEGQGLSLYFQDPDGNVIKLKAPYREPKQVGSNMSFNRSANGMAPWPRSALLHHAPRGQGATPSSPG